MTYLNYISTVDEDYFSFYSDEPISNGCYVYIPDDIPTPVIGSTSLRDAEASPPLPLAIDWAAIPFDESEWKKAVKEDIDTVVGEWRRGFASPGKFIEQEYKAKETAANLWAAGNTDPSVHPEVQIILDEAALYELHGVTTIDLFGSIPMDVTTPDGVVNVYLFNAGFMGESGFALQKSSSVRLSSKLDVELIESSGDIKVFEEERKSIMAALYSELSSIPETFLLSIQSR